jgi:O-antigen/teichoic acid export membrane protein
MADNSQNNKRIVKNTFFLYVRMFFVMLLALYSTRVILQAIGVLDYGIYNVVAGFVSLFAVLNNSLTTGTSRFYNYALGKSDQNEVVQVYNASLRIQILLLIVLIVVTEFIGMWYINNKMNIPIDRLSAAIIVFQYSLISLVFLALQIPYSAAVMAYERMDYYAIVSIIVAIGKLGICFLVMYTSYDKLVLYGILLTSISAINYFLYFFYCKKKFPYLRIIKVKDKGLFKSLLTFSGWSVLDPFSYIVRDQGSNMTLNLFFGPIVNAAYGIAAQVSGAVTGFSSSLSIAFRPQIIQSYSGGDYKRTKQLMLSMSKINYALQILFAIPLIFELKYILSLWLGKDYPPFTLIFSILVLMINCFNTLNEPISIIMVATGRIKKIKSISLVIICSVVPIGYLMFTLGLPPYAIYIAMFVLTIINQISCVMIMTSEFKGIKPMEYFKAILIPCLFFTLLALLVPFCISLILQISFVRLVLTFLLTSISTLALSYLILLSDTERNLVKEMFNKTIHKFHIK